MELREALKLVWNEERIDKFIKELEGEVSSYKIDCLEKFIEDIIENDKLVDETKLKRYCKNMDAFENGRAFLFDFFTAIKTPEGDIVAERVQEDEDEANRIIENLIERGAISVKEVPGEFIVWYR